MANSDQAIELQGIQVLDSGPVVQVVREPNPDELRLLEHLKKREYADFETTARVGLENEPPTIDINYVYPEKEKTVLDIASSDGLDEFVQLILHFRADPNKVNVVKERSPLHFAAEAGNFGVLEILLTHSKIEPNLKVNGRTALHLAVIEEEVECVEVLLKYNADANIADSEGLTPLHVAAITEQEEIVPLLILKKADVRCVDSYGNTALHYAAMVESSEVISMLLVAGSSIGHENALGISPIIYIDPETISRYLDYCLRTDEDRSRKIDNNSEYKIGLIALCRDYYVDDYEIEFNYKCLSPISNTTNNLEKGATDDNNICMEMRPLLHIAKRNSHQHLLENPILSSFLYLKWQRIRPILYTNYIFYLLFCLLLNSYIWSMTYSTEGIKENEENTKSNKSIDNDTSQSLTADWKWYANRMEIPLRYLTAIALFILFLREMVQLILSPRDHFRNFENWLELVLIFFSIAVLGGAGISVGALTILLSAWELIILIGQDPRMSIAIEMLNTVTWSFFLFLSRYVPLIVAFTLAFYTLFKDGDKSSFSDLGQSFFKTVIMFTGEFDTNSISFGSHPILSHFVFLLFVFLIATVLFNLLNGLAVSDTAKILSEAELVCLISRTKLVAYVERTFVGPPIVTEKIWLFQMRKFIKWMMNNSLWFLSENIPLFDKVLPEAKIKVSPLRSNAVSCPGENDKKNTGSKLTMDRQIITHAEEIISRQGRISDYLKLSKTVEKFSNQVDRRLQTIEALIRNINQL